MQLWLIPILPLAGFLINGLLGRRFSKGTVNAVAIGSVALSFAWVLKTIFALGALLHEMLTGDRPFGRVTVGETMGAILNAEPLPLEPRAGKAPAALARVIRRCLEKEPDQRLQSALDVAFALSEVTTSPRVASPQTNWSLAAVAPASRYAWFAGRNDPASRGTTSMDSPVRRSADLQFSCPQRERA